MKKNYVYTLISMLSFSISCSTKDGLKSVTKNFDTFEIFCHYNEFENQTKIFLTNNFIKTDSLTISDYYGSFKLKEFSNNFYIVYYTKRTGTDSHKSFQIIITRKGNKIKICNYFPYEDYYKSYIDLDTSFNCDYKIEIVKASNKYNTNLEVRNYNKIIEVSNLIINQDFFLYNTEIYINQEIINKKVNIDIYNKIKNNNKIKGIKIIDKVYFTIDNLNYVLNLEDKSIYFLEL